MVIWLLEDMSIVLHKKFEGEVKLLCWSKGKEQFLVSAQ